MLAYPGRADAHDVVGNPWSRSSGVSTSGWHFAELQGFPRPDVQVLILRGPEASVVSALWHVG